MATLVRLKADGTVHVLLEIESASHWLPVTFGNLVRQQMPDTVRDSRAFLCSETGAVVDVACSEIEIIRIEGRSPAEWIKESPYR